MKPGAHVLVAAAARLYAPLIALFALLIMARGTPGSGVGVAAGLAFALVLALHALVFGAAAARAALPPLLARLMLGLGVAIALVSAGLNGLAYGPHLIEAGAFVATIAAAALIIQVIFGRVPTLRDGAL